MRIVELIQYLPQVFMFAHGNFGVVKLAARRGKLVEVGRGAALTIHETCQYLYEYAFIGGQMRDDILYRPHAARAWCLPRCFGEALDGSEYSELAILQDVGCVHWMVVPSSLPGTEMMLLSSKTENMYGKIRRLHREVY